MQTMNVTQCRLHSLLPPTWELASDRSCTHTLIFKYMHSRAANLICYSLQGFTRVRASDAFVVQLQVYRKIVPSIFFVVISKGGSNNQLKVKKTKKKQQQQ